MLLSFLRNYMHGHSLVKQIFMHARMDHRGATKICLIILLEEVDNVMLGENPSRFELFCLYQNI